MAVNRTFRSHYTVEQIEDLIEHGSPIIQDGHWFRWDVEAQEYVDTGITADSEVAAEAAEAAQAAAELAQGKAEDAQDAAETAQGLAEDARDAAAASAASIAASAAQIDANTARIDYVALREEEDRQILFGSVVEAAEDEYPELRSAPIHNAITIGQSVYPRMDRTRMAIDRIAGRTVAFNQLVADGKFSRGAGEWNTYTENGVTFSYNSDGSIRVTGTPTGRAYCYACSSAWHEKTGLANHKLFMSVTSNAPTGVTFSYGYHDANNTWIGSGNITQPTVVSVPSNVAFVAAIAIDVGASLVGTALDFNVKLQFTDLTQMYGTTLADSIYAMEQATTGAGVAYVRQRLDLDYYAPNSGELKAPVVSGVTVTGFNQWDEEWEVGGVNVDTGGTTESTDRIRSKNYIRVEQNAQYCFSSIRPTDFYIQIVMYDENKTYLGRADGYIAKQKNQVFATNENCHYIKFGVDPSYGTTYNHDICINVSKPTGTPKNGDYLPYLSTSLPIPSTRLDGVGTAQDVMYVREDGENDYSLHLHKVMGEVDLGAQIWTRSTSYANPFFYTNAVIHDSSAEITCVCDSYVALANCTASAFGNNAPNKSVAMQMVSDNQVYIRDDSYTDAETFTTAMSGKKLVYKLKTPTETVIDEHLTLADISAIAENGGIISVENSNGHIVQPDLTCDTVISRSAS